MTVPEVASELRTLTASVSRELAAAGDEAAGRKLDEGRWSAKEVLGHLIDSATNNHQRFVRAQHTDALTFPGYDQNQWVRSQDYQDADWAQLVALWNHFNLHLADVINSIPPAKYATPCAIGGADAVPLESVITGYLSHVKHHLAQIRERLS
jgi:DinB family protein